MTRRRAQRGLPLLIASAACLVFLYACGPELTRRYETAKGKASKDPVANLTVFPRSPDSAPSSRIVADLSPQGQAAFIEKASADPAAAVRAASATWPRPGGTLDHTTFSTTLVFSLSKVDLEDLQRLNTGNAGEHAVFQPSLMLANRIESAEITITLVDSCQGKFASWDRFETERDTVQLGSIKLTQAGSVEASLSPAIPSSVASAGGLKATGSRTLEETLQLTQQRIKLSGTLEPDRATLYQEGGLGLDLTGNSSVRLAIRVTPQKPEEYLVGFANLFKDGVPNPPEQVLVTEVKLIRPDKSIVDAGADIYATVSGQAMLRQVISGARTIIEGDDQALYVWGSMGVKVPPVAKEVGSSPSVPEKASPPADAIKLVSWGDLKKAFTVFTLELNGEYLYLVDTDPTGKVPEGPLPERSYHQLSFGTYEDALAFLTWLRLQQAPLDPHIAKRYKVRGIVANEQGQIAAVDTLKPDGAVRNILIAQY